MKKKINGILTIALLLSTSGCFLDSSNTGYKVFKKEEIAVQMGNGVKASQVSFSGCEYVRVKEYKDVRFYYKAEYSLNLPSGEIPKTRYFSWIKGNESVDTISSYTYEDILNGVNDHSLKGWKGSCKE